ncbi:peptidase S8/S53 domain-containing protein [Pavlovales sp. CCMP2436]|nr:peptidase S8/S53 domain-containing protein [Pavlovales sp. CCMP2436]
MVGKATLLVIAALATPTIAAIPREYVVEFSAGALSRLPLLGTLADTPETRLRELIRAAPAGSTTVRYLYTRLLYGISGLLTDLAVDYFEGIGGVVELDLGTNKSAVKSWGLDRIDQADLPLNSNYKHRRTGVGVDIFVLDTGLNSGHADFQGRIGDGYDFVDQVDFVSADCDGHGTHCAGTALGSEYGVAGAATVHAVRVLDCDGTGRFGDFIAGLEWVDEHAADQKVVTASLGGPTSQTVNKAVNALVDRGVVVVVASGNDGADACNYSPASATKAITVGATTINDKAAYYSNAGSCVDVLAPGSDITSAWIGSSSATEVLSGTSMACPHVAGVAAQYMQRLGANPTAIVNAIKADAVAGIIQDSSSDANRNNPNLFIQADTQAQSAPPSPREPDLPPGLTVDVRITPDAYPGQISWTLSKLDGALVASAQLSMTSAPLVQQLWNVALETEHGTSQLYRFMISDANSDGICCTYGPGTYSLEVDGTLLKSGGQFAASESTNFKVIQLALPPSAGGGGDGAVSPPPPSSPLSQPASSQQNLGDVVSKFNIIIACVGGGAGLLLLGAAVFICYRYGHSRRRWLARDESLAALSPTKRERSSIGTMPVGLEIRPSPDRSQPDPSVEKHSDQWTFAEHTDTVPTAKADQTHDNRRLSD